MLYGPKVTGKNCWLDPTLPFLHNLCNFLISASFVFSSKVINAFLESSNPDIKKMAKEELQPLVENGCLSLPNEPTAKND